MVPHQDTGDLAGRLKVPRGTLCAHSSELYWMPAGASHSQLLLEPSYAMEAVLIDLDESSFRYALGASTQYSVPELVCTETLLVTKLTLPLPLNLGVTVAVK
jgi:hypothetical protein